MFKVIKQYLKNILIWLDEGLNVLLLGDPDETLSSRAAKWAEAGYVWPARIIDFLFGKEHCKSSLQEDRGTNEIQVERDKQLHFICGVFICLIIGWMINPLWGFVATIAIGVLKEIWDKFIKQSVPDIWDAIATFAGGLAGYFINFLITI